METERIVVESGRLCRACGAERLHMFLLLARDPDGALRFDDMLVACTDLKIRVGDGLPSSICYSCADELKTSYRFKQQCETTDRYFYKLGLKSNEIKQEQETVVFKEGENENLLELKEEKDRNDNLSCLSLKEVTEGISEAVEISRETKEEQGDLLTITETIVYKHEEKFSELTEDEAIRVGNLEDSPNEDLCLEDFPHKKENRKVVSQAAENEKHPSGSKEQKEEETIDDGGSEASSSSEDDDSDYFPWKELRKTNQLGRFKRNVRRKYSSSSNLQMHKQTHESEGRKRFNCDLCEKSYASRDYLREHKKMHENGGWKRLTCDVCEKTFSMNRYLQAHKKKHENGERKRFKCDICGKSYCSRVYLRDHKAMHGNGGRKCFMCDICGKSYSLSKSLREHKEMHDNGEGKCFKCDVCKKSFSRSAYLWKHKKTHENGGGKCFKCDVCGKLYTRRRYLQEHKKVHDNGGRKCFKCDVCKKSFSRSGYLWKHKKTHKNGGGKYFKCDGISS